MKSGFITLPVVLVIVGLLLAGSLFLLIPNPQTSPRDLLPEVQSSIEQYQAFLEHLNRDGKYAGQIRVGETSLTFVAIDESQVVYRYSHGTLTREQPGQSPTPLLTNLGSVRFSRGQLLPQLTSIFIVFANNQLPSFFTSVTPRGVRP